MQEKGWETKREKAEVMNTQLRYTAFDVEAMLAMSPLTAKHAAGPVCHVFNGTNGVQPNHWFCGSTNELRKLQNENLFINIILYFYILLL